MDIVFSRNAASGVSGSARRLFDRSFRRQGDQHRGRRRNDVNQRQRLGSPNSGQRQYERERMMRRRATRTNHQGQRIHLSASTGRRHDRSRNVHSSFKETLDHGASRHGRYLRSPDGSSRREADTAGAGLGRLSWAVSTPTRVASGRTGVRAKSVIPLRARNRLHSP
jgi:hypothetical protein